MRIALVTETWLPAVDGVVTRLSHTVTDLAARGHEVLVLAATVGTARPGVRQLQLPGCRFRVIDRDRRWALPYPRLARTLHEFGADVVHVVNPVLMGSLGTLSLAGRHPLVASLHTDVAEYAARYRLRLLQPTLRRLTSAAYGRADVRLATSPTGVDLIEDLGAGPATIWPAAVDDLFLRGAGPVGGGPGPLVRPEPPDPPEQQQTPQQAIRVPQQRPVSVLCVGRLAREKQYERLRPALVAAGGTLQLTFVGDGPDRSRLERLFAGLPATFLGTRRGEPLVQAYRDADVLAFTSTTDTVGLVLLEAAALGLPVVAVDARATRDTLAGYGRLELVPTSAGADHWTAALRRAVQPSTGVTPWAGTNSWRTSTDVLLDAYAAATGGWRERRGPTRTLSTVGV